MTVPANRKRRVPARGRKRADPARAGTPSTASAAQQTPNRLARSRLRTRGRLIEAALVVMGRKGVEAATIADVAAEADVGVGSFYNHFKSKEHLAQEVFRLRAAELAQELVGILDRVDDAALAASFVQRWFIERGRRDPVWGWFVIHAEAALDVVESTFRDRIRDDLQRGCNSGRFSIPSLDTAVSLTLAAILATMRRQLEGAGHPQMGSEMVEALMRMYGLEKPEAHAIAYEPLPAWLGK